MLTDIYFDRKSKNLFGNLASKERNLQAKISLYGCLHPYLILESVEAVHFPAYQSKVNFSKIVITLIAIVQSDWF